MFGINGYIPNNKSGVFSIEKIVETMNNTILHRGRAQDGIFIDKRPHCTIGMVLR